MIIKKYLHTVFIIFFALAICLFANVAIADEHGGHGGGGNHGGGGHYHGNNYHNGYNNNGVYISPFFSPFYYPYYYPNTFIVVQPSSSGSHTTSAPAPTSQSSVITMKAQVELVSQGYYHGSVDGIAGHQTSAAITAFQHDKGLAETGTLDDATLKALGVKK